MSESDGLEEPDDYPGVAGMEQKRPALTAPIVRPRGEANAEGDTFPLSASRHFIERDETAGLVGILFHAQQAVLLAGNCADDARDANDDELALFLEEAQRESSARAERAKRLLAQRLNRSDAASD